VPPSTTVPDQAAVLLLEHLHPSEAILHAPEAAPDLRELHTQIVDQLVVLALGHALRLREDTWDHEVIPSPGSGQGGGAKATRINDESEGGLPGMAAWDGAIARPPPSTPDRSTRSLQRLGFEAKTDEVGDSVARLS
jgi:hypothetical protein